MKEYLLKYFDEDLINKVLTTSKYKRLIDSENNKNKKSKIDIEVAQTLYNKYKLPLYKIAMLFGVSDVTLRKYLIDKQAPMRGHRCGQNSQNDYFKTIDSIDKAYYLGLIFADGNIREDSRGGGRKIFQIALTEEDKYILERFNKYANFKSKLYIDHKEDEKPRYSLNVYSASIYDDLVKLGVNPRKSKEGIAFIPDLDDKYISHFIRGYFDGDGIAKKQGYIGFCGDLKILQFIKDKLIKNCNVTNNTLTFNKANNIYYIQWSKAKDVQAIFDYIYKDKKDLYLTRKYLKIKNRPSIQ